MRRLIIIPLLLWSAAALAEPGAQPAPGSQKVPASTKAAAPSTDEECLGCHDDSKDTFKFEDGGTLSVAVDRKKLEASVHAKKVECVDCHKDVGNSYPHPERKYKSRRAYAIARYEVCKRCHFANYTRTVDGVHFKQLLGGNQKAPVCTDCHGAHDVRKPDRPRAAISTGCARCHGAINDAYSQSVHGAALKDNNPDVPVCTDCHRAHDVADPRTVAFRLGEPQMCGSCHADEKRMSKYKISTAVLKTYLKDFHGVTASFRRKEHRNDVGAWQAVCTDCHGVHDIKRPEDPKSSVMRANLARTCRRCHKDATDNFPVAWLSHYEPSPKKASLVFYIQKTYDVLIPFVIIGLLLHVLMHIWRVTINR